MSQSHRQHRTRNAQQAVEPVMDNTVRRSRRQHELQEQQQQQQPSAPRTRCGSGGRAATTTTRSLIPRGRPAAASQQSQPHNSQQSQPGTSKQSLMTTPVSSSSSSRKEQSKTGSQVRSDKKAMTKEMAALDKDTVVKNGILYLTCTTGNKIPIKKYEFMQRVLGKEKREPDFVSSVLRRIQRTLENVFGYQIWAYSEFTGETSMDINQSGYNFWFVISKHKGITKIIDAIKDPTVDDNARKVKQSILIMTLTMIFMQSLDYGIEENELWKAIVMLGFDRQLDLAEKDFKKFMKTEFIAPMYLKLKEERNEEHGLATYRYVWGPRAHLEISKWSLLKHAVQQFPGSKPQDFEGPYQYLLNSAEARTVRAELREWEKYALGSDSSEVDENEGGSESVGAEGNDNGNEVDDEDTDSRTTID